MPIGKNSIARAAKAMKPEEEKTVILPEIPEQPPVAAAEEKPAPKKRGRKPGSKNQPKPAAKKTAKKTVAASAVIADISPEVVEKVAKPKKKKAPESPKSAFAIGEELPEYLL